MIAWWGWLIIWAVLVLGLLVMLGVLAWWLFRKALTLLTDLGELSAQTELLSIDDSELHRPQRAVLASARDVRERESARKRRRAEVRRASRERRLARARALTRLDASRQEWPASWYSAKRRHPGVD